MKKTLGMLVVVALALSGSAIAGAKAKTHAKAPGVVAREACTKKGLTGKELQDCIKTELASKKKPAAATEKPAEQSGTAAGSKAPEEAK